MLREQGKSKRRIRLLKNGENGILSSRFDFPGKLFNIAVYFENRGELEHFKFSLELNYPRNWNFVASKITLPIAKTFLNLSNYHSNLTPFTLSTHVQRIRPTIDFPMQNRIQPHRSIIHVLVCKSYKFAQHRSRNQPTTEFFETFAFRFFLLAVIVRGIEIVNREGGKGTSRANAWKGRSRVINRGRRAATIDTHTHIYIYRARTNWNWLVIRGHSDGWLQPR